MDERSLIYDWNTIDYEFNRNPSNHPHGVWFDDETLRDGLQSPSARNPSIEEKVELLSYMEKLGIPMNNSTKWAYEKDTNMSYFKQYKRQAGKPFCDLDY